MMMSSSQYSPNMQHRVSPVLESEEDYDDSDDYSPTDNNLDCIGLGGGVGVGGVGGCVGGGGVGGSGEAYLVTDFYHQPIPLPPSTYHGSDSGPEYSTPFANASNAGTNITHSPGSMRHVFTPSTSAFQQQQQQQQMGAATGTKQKPRMGVMATRSLSEKNPTPTPPNPKQQQQQCVDMRNQLHLGELPPSQHASSEELDSPVYDSTQYIVTPTRRRNSENDKSPSGRNYVRRGGGDRDREHARPEYPEVRGRPGEGEELGMVPPGVVLLQPNMFQDGTLDSRILSDIEMTNLRAAMRLSPDTDTSGDSSTVQDRLLNPHQHQSNNSHHHPHPHSQHPHQQELAHHGLLPHHTLNGNGMAGGGNQHFVQQGQGKHHQAGVYSLGAPRLPRPMTGSGVVFRRKRKPCWCVLLVVVAVALMAAGISLGVLFGVMKTGEDLRGGDESPRLVGNGASNSSSSSSSGGDAPSSGADLRGGGGDASKTMTDPSSLPPSSTSTTTSRSSSTDRPIVLPPDQQPPPVHGAGSGSTKPLSNWGVSVRRFKAYWHPGDSRVMEVLLSNGTVLQAAGHKDNDGTFRGLYSLSMTEGQGRTTRVRFMGGRNLASIILPSGTVVSLDWSANNADLECKVFQIPPPKGAPGGGPDVMATPTSHLATLQLGVHSYVLRQISRTLDEASATPGAWEEEEPLSATPTPKFCAPRLPVKVTKCGGQYPYDGAFVQGEVALQTGPSLSVAALPWLDDDDCYSEFKPSLPNFFIPLPGHVDMTTTRRIAARFWRTAARWWGRVCDVVGTVLEVDLERHKVCANMAASAQTQLSHGGLYNVVYDSCSALLSSLHLTCRTLDDLITRAAHTAAATSASRGSSGSSGNSASGSGGLGSSRQPASQELLQKVLANATSLQEPATSVSQEIHIRIYAFCPSSQPQSSFDKTITLTASDEEAGMFSRDVTSSDLVHVNCPGHPEVTYFYLGHAAAIEPLDMVKHRLKVCAVCAFEKTVSVHVQRDHMCCNDTCTRESRCEDSISEARLGLGLSESHTFDQQTSVYCHEFLTAADTPTRALSPGCLGTCQSNLEVRFQVKDSTDDPGKVYLDQVLTCLEGYRSTCKSTFGH